MTIVLIYTHHFSFLWSEIKVHWSHFAIVFGAIIRKHLTRDLLENGFSESHCKNHWKMLSKNEKFKVNIQAKIILDYELRLCSHFADMFCSKILFLCNSLPTQLGQCSGIMFHMWLRQSSLSSPQIFNMASTAWKTNNSVKNNQSCSKKYYEIELSLEKFYFSRFLIPCQLSHTLRNVLYRIKLTWTKF